MARYEVLVRSHFNQPRSRIVEAGEEIEHDGVPGSNLRPLDEPARKAVAKAQAEREKRAEAVEAKRRAIEAFGRQP